MPLFSCHTVVAAHDRLLRTMDHTSGAQSDYPATETWTDQLVSEHKPSTGPDRPSDRPLDQELCSDPDDQEAPRPTHCMCSRVSRLFCTGERSTGSCNDLLDDVISVALLTTRRFLICARSVTLTSSDRFHVHMISEKEKVYTGPKQSANQLYRYANIMEILETNFLALTTWRSCPPTSKTDRTTDGCGGRHCAVLSTRTLYPGSISTRPVAVEVDTVPCYPYGRCIRVLSPHRRWLWR
ncbi:hypothetical protein RRG08_012044 [Elysia crispata]|uniref:Uncharacterized protein n=1 Tax=Elysia crispata TaxID=231223 RepID=A0AAE0XV85_9GAST|nr:hypothetical protein RRG08_012044 [Elysia crispata]